MPEVNTLVLRSEELSDEAVARLQLRMREFEELAYKRLEDWLKRFDSTDGSIVPGAKAIALLNTIKRELAGIVEMKALTDASKDFLTSFDGIADNVRAIHGEENGLKVPKSLVTPSKQYAIEQTDFSLRTAGVNLRFIEPVRKALFNHINFGAGVKETEDMLRLMLTGRDADGNVVQPGALAQYIGQVAHDAIHQYEGVVNTAIAVDNGLTGVHYVNSLIRTSRAQCVRWVQMEWLTEEEIPSEIEWAKEKGSGMVDETTATTFLIYRGGHRCRHKGIPVRNAQAKKMRGGGPGPVPTPKPKSKPKPKPAPEVPPPPAPTPPPPAPKPTPPPAPKLLTDAERAEVARIAKAMKKLKAATAVSEKQALAKVRKAWKEQNVGGTVGEEIALNRDADLTADFVQRVLPNLTNEERRAIKDYTANEFKFYNDHLRGIEAKPHFEPEINTLRGVLNRFRSVEPIVAFRRVNSDYSEQLLQQVEAAGVGAEITMPGFSSTSISSMIAMGKVVLRLYVPTGSKALYLEDMTSTSGELELLLDHATRARILGVQTVKGRSFIDLLVIP